MAEKIKNIKRFFSLKKRSIFMIGLFFVLGVFFIGAFVRADVLGIGEAVGSSFKDTIITVISAILGTLVNLLGKVLLILMKLLVAVASYNGFINSAAVTYGWAIVRDICNMFFIVILLVIAFATILRIEGYDIKKMVPRLIIMAVLINFSKTICGLIIDAAQIIMNVFVNSFGSFAHQSMTQMMGLQKLLTFADSSAGGTNAATILEVFNAYVFATIYLLVALAVILILVGVLVVRIVMLWIYIVLSPLAYLLATFPQGKGYAARWWKEFTDNVVVGPILAFFLWLSMISLGSSSDGASILMQKDGGSLFSLESDINMLTQVMTSDNVLKFIISIGMLMGGLIIAKGTSGQVGGIVGAGMAKIQAGGLALRKRTVDRAATAVKEKAAAAGRFGLGATRTGIGFADKSLGAVAGKVLGKAAPTKGAGIAKEMREAGLVGAAYKATFGLPALAVGGVKNRAAQKRVWDAKRRDALSSSEIESGGTKYREKAGYYEDAAGKRLVDEKGREVKKMGGTEAVWFDSWNKSISGARAVSNKVQDEAIDKEHKKIVESGASEGELRRDLMSALTPPIRKMALSMALAVKKGFRDNKEVKEAEKSLSSNSILLDKFRDTVYKNQADLAFDFSTTKDRYGNDQYSNQMDIDKFKEAIDQGKVDSSRLNADAYKDKGIIRALKEFHGREFSEVMKTAFKRGKKHEETVAEGLLDSRDMANLKDDKSARTHAKLTGNTWESYKDQQTGFIDLAAMGEYIKNAKASDLNRMDANDLDKAIGANPQYDINNSVICNVDFSKLQSLYRQADNPRLVERIIRAMKHAPAGTVSQQTLDSLQKDRSLSSIYERV